MKKSLCAALVALILPLGAVADTGPYVAGTLSIQHTRYDINGWMNEQLNQGNYPLYLQAITAAGGTFNTGYDFTGLSGKVTLGYQLTERSAVEVHYRQYSDISAWAQAHVGASASSNDTYRGHTASGSISASADASAVATASATGFGLSYVAKVWQPWFLRVGAEHIVAKLDTTATTSWAYSWQAQLDSRRWAGSGGQTTSDPSTDGTTVWAPLLGFGIEKPIDAHLSYRVEFEHVGIIKDGFDFYSVSLKYRF